MRELKASAYTCGLGLVIGGLALYSYYVRELLASLVLFGVASSFLGLVVLGVFLVWCAGEKAAIWARFASRNMIALSRRLLAAYARP